MEGKRKMKNKRFLAPVISLLMILTLFASCGSSGDSTAEDVILEIINDGDTTMITDAAYDEYFGGSAVKGVKALLAAGKVYVNGVQVPAAEDNTVDYQVNGVASLYKTNSGWGYNVHKTTSANNLSFEAARLGFFETITTVRGHSTVLYGDGATGQANRIDAESFDVVRLAEITRYNESIHIVRGDFELETNRIRPDVNNIVFHSSKFDNEILVGDIAVFYYGTDGWVIEKAVPVAGTLSKNEDGDFVINKGRSDEYVHIESNVSRYNLIDCNRPTQFYTAYVSLGMTEIPVVTWCTPTGHPIGFTYGDRAASKEALSLALANATTAKENVVVSADGMDVAEGAMWIAQEDLDEYDSVIAAAQAAYNRNLTAVQEFDTAIYTLGLALGEAGERPTGFLGAQGEGQSSDYEDHSAASHIMETLAKGWTTVYSDGTFRPDDPITRADFAVMLWRVLGAVHGGGGNPFVDVLISAEYYDAVLALNDMGIILEDGGGRFAPNNTLSREGRLHHAGEGVRRHSGEPVWERRVFGRDHYIKLGKGLHISDDRARIY